MSKSSILGGALVLLAFLAAVVLFLSLRNLVPPVNVSPLSIPGGEVSTPNWDAWLADLANRASDLDLIEVPEAVDDLYSAHLTLIDEDLIGTNIALTEEERVRLEISKLFWGDLLTAEIDRLADELEQSLTTSSDIDLIPDEVIEIEAKRLLVRETLVYLAKQILLIEQRLAELEGENGPFEPGTFDWVRQELRGLKQQVMENIQYLFGDAAVIVELVRQLLDGQITEEQFRIEWGNRLPPITWEWLS